MLAKREVVVMESWFDYYVKKSVVLLAVCAALCFQGCGGGTTGTSITGDSGELKLLGQANGVDNKPAANKSMVVYSGEGEKELGESETDSEGRFEMSLPGSEKSVVVEIDSEPSVPLSRVYEGSSVLNTFLVRQPIRQSRRKMITSRAHVLPGTPPAPGSMPGKPFRGCKCRKPGWRPSYSVRYTLELAVSSDSICDKLSAINNKIYIQDPLDSEQCNVELVAFTKQFSLTDFQSTLVASCSDGERRVASVRSNQQGKMVVDLAEAYRQGCTPVKIVSSGMVGQNYPITIPILDGSN